VAGEHLTPGGGGITPVDDAVSRLMTRSLLEVFGQRDPDRRAAAMAAIYATDITFHEHDRVSTGTEAVAARVQDLLDGAPGWVFRPVGEVAVNHDLGRLHWSFGPDGAAPALTGTDVAHVAGGRISSLYVFLDDPPSTGSEVGSDLAAGQLAVDTYRLHLRSDEFSYEHEVHASAVDREDGWTVFWSGDDAFLRVRDEHIVSLELLI
jgi:SnoaL-like protein